MHMDHTFKPFDTDLRVLYDEVIAMGEAVAGQIDAAISALLEYDRDRAEAVIAADTGIDALEKKIDQLVLQTLTRQQPMAQDLRDILAAQRIAIDLERAGDHARGIARRALALNGHMPATAAAQIGWLARRMRTQFAEALEAYRERDVAKAEHVWETDIDLDIIYNDFFQHLLVEMQKDMDNIVCCTHLMFVAKALERIGDHATNISESLSFAVTGKLVTRPSTKGSGV